MSKIVRALILSAAATGAAALVVVNVQKRLAKQPQDLPKGPAEVDADSLSEGEVKRLTDELGAML